MLTKRKYHYIHPPKVYGVALCPKCGDNDTEWSEYAEHIWCYNCEEEYIPAHWGIFDGPISPGVCKTLGISFDRVEIATGRVIKDGDPEWKDTFDK